MVQVSLKPPHPNTWERKYQSRQDQRSRYRARFLLAKPRVSSYHDKQFVVNVWTSAVMTASSWQESVQICYPVDAPWKHAKAGMHDAISFFVHWTALPALRSTRYHLRWKWMDENVSKHPAGSTVDKAAVPVNRLRFSWDKVLGGGREHKCFQKTMRTLLMMCLQLWGKLEPL